jgi:hypothetical protein
MLDSFSFLVQDSIYRLSTDSGDSPDEHSPIPPAWRGEAMGKRFRSFQGKVIYIQTIELKKMILIQSPFLKHGRVGVESK